MKERHTGAANAKSWGRSDRHRMFRRLSKDQTGRGGTGVASESSAGQHTSCQACLGISVLVPLAAEGPWAGCFTSPGLCLLICKVGS